VVAVLIGVVAWQQFNIHCLKEDMDQIMDSHNDLVDVMDTVLQGILVAAGGEDDD
jgi:hypothetical protein